MTVLKAVGAYILTFGLFFAFLWWFFDNPREHEVLISVVTAFFASATAGGIIEDASFDDERERLINAVITAVVTSGIWVYVFYDDYSERVERFADHQFLSAVGSVMNMWDALLIAAITFVTIIARVKKP